MREIIRLRPRDAVAYNNMCWACVLLHEPAEALPLCLKSVRLMPNQSYPLESLGYVYLEQRRYDKAKRTFDRVLSKNTVPSSIYGRAMAETKLGQSKASLADKTRAEQLSPGISLAQANAGFPL